MKLSSLRPYNCYTARPKEIPHTQQSMEEAPLLRIWSARSMLAELEMTSDKLPSAREALAEAVQALLEEVASKDVPETERRELDMALSPAAKDLKSALLKALRLCSCARGFLGLPALMEETRKLLCAAPAKGVGTYVEVALCADIDQCTAARALAAVVDLMAFMTGQSLETGKSRLKKELGGHELPATHKKSCRTALNKAAKALEALEAAARKASLPAAAAARKVEIERDFRLDEATDEACRKTAQEAGLVAIFGNALHPGVPGQRGQQQDGGSVDISTEGGRKEAAPPPRQFEMPEGSLAEMRLEDAHRTAAVAVGVEELVEQALSKRRAKREAEA